MGFYLYFPDGEAAGDWVPVSASAAAYAMSVAAMVVRLATAEELGIQDSVEK